MKAVEYIILFLLFGLPAAWPMIAHGADSEKAAAESRRKAAELLDEAKKFDKSYDDKRAFLAAARARAAVGIRSPRQWNDEDRKLVDQANQQMKACSERLRKDQGYLSDYTTLVISYHYKL